jgi:hypothetical protein
VGGCFAGNVRCARNDISDTVYSSHCSVQFQLTDHHKRTHPDQIHDTVLSRITDFLHRFNGHRSRSAAGTTVIRVEEGQVACIRNPDGALGTSQTANVISPIPSTAGACGMGELNHWSRPAFKGGGHQVQSWIGERNNGLAFSDETNLLIRDYDKLDHTVGMELTSDKLEFF